MDIRSEPMSVSAIDPIDRDEMVGLATTEFVRFLSILRDLEPEDWARPTDCEAWDVREMVAHLLGAAEANASTKENLRQLVRGGRLAKRTGRPTVDGVNDVQVADRRHLTPAQLLERLETVAPEAVRGRHRTPRPLRAIPVPDPTGGTMRLGFLVDIVYTRDQWLHRVDLARATGRSMLLTADHDTRIVADVVRQWANVHGQPVDLELTGPAGGSYRQGTGGRHLSVDAVEFCRILSGRSTTDDDLLAVPIVF